MLGLAALRSWSLAALFACAGCGQPEYEVVVRFAPESLASEVTRIEVALVPSCATQAPGEPATDALRSVAWERSGSSEALGVVDPGQYGLYARGLSGACGVVASGCAPVTLEDGGDGELVVTMGPASGAGCAPGAMCVSGECVSADGGVGTDGGVSCDTVIAVGAGLGTACAIGGSGAVYCWGSNQYGEIGDGTTGGVRNAPVRAGAATTWIEIVVGGDHACGRQSDGSVWCWGENDYGQLGTGDDTSRAVPTRVGTGTSWVALHAGESHTCALDTSDALWCWGDNRQGQLGLGDTNDRNVPQPVPAATWSAFALGWDHTCAIALDGTLWCWGTNGRGELGDGTTTRRTSPVQVGTATDWSRVAAGDQMTCAIDESGSLWCWGANDEGQLGNGTYDASDAEPSPTPARVGDGTDWSAVAIADNNLCGLRAAGSLWCWGDNDMGEAGIGSGDSRITAPVRVGTLDGWGAMDGGEDFHCAIRDAALFCWGSNVDGELGVGDMANRGQPIEVCLPL